MPIPFYFCSSLKFFPFHAWRHRSSRSCLSLFRPNMVRLLIASHVSLSDLLHVCLFVCLFVCLSVLLFCFVLFWFVLFCLFVCLCACLSECLSVRLHSSCIAHHPRYLDGFRINTWEPRRHIGIVRMPRTASVLPWCNCFESSLGIVSTTSLHSLDSPLSQIPSLSALLSSKSRLHGSEKDGSRPVSCALVSNIQAKTSAPFVSMKGWRGSRCRDRPPHAYHTIPMKCLCNWVAATVGFYTVLLFLLFRFFRTGTALPGQKSEGQSVYWSFCWWSKMEDPQRAIQIYSACHLQVCTASLHCRQLDPGIVQLPLWSSLQFSVALATWLWQAIWDTLGPHPTEHLLLF